MEPTFKTYIIRAVVMYEVSAPTLGSAKCVPDAIYDRARQGRPLIHFDDDVLASQIYIDVTGSQSERYAHPDPR